MTPSPTLRIGTRGSRLALAQTGGVRDLLIAAHPALAAPGAVEIVVIRTTGDAVQDRPLAEIGGKGLFTREIDEAMLEGRIDIAVHSVKDVPTWLPEGIEMPCILAREDPRDALICNAAKSLSELPEGAVVGTASLRRQAQVLARRPDLVVRVLRGNVETRIKKIAEGAFDATLLAIAGLKRIGLAGAATAILEPEEMLPAVGQGAIGVTCRTADDKATALLAAVHDAGTAACVAAERALLAMLDGSCRTPIAAFAVITESKQMMLRGLLARPDGSRLVTVACCGTPAEAVMLGEGAGRDLLARFASDGREHRR
ncbi:hydroxymethylbilane synthase [Shumkonia mesophila]|uniref:hydroxymethylbilane synthase n=1 Tax=Shumkonia mesophila TaxID=2838854 RepID=UPI002934AF78|nr:hydroxymethylbilane synthase [Shumkonia mesophila]